MAEPRKNLYPLILAVIISLIATYFVSVMIKKKEVLLSEDKIEVIKTLDEVKAGKTLQKEDLEIKSIPISAKPPRVFTAKQEEILLGQKLVRDLPAGAYVQLDDVAVDNSMNDTIAEGKWAISVSLNGGAISRRLRPGHEIAIIGTFEVIEELGGKSSDEKPILKRRKVTTVILPRVSILSIDTERRQGSDEFVLALNPEEAQVLIAAQNQGVELTPALRKPNDDTNLSRISTKLVDKETFNKLVQDIETVSVPTSMK